MNSSTAELINEEEAARVARVSASTLARFAEAGYFQVEVRGSQRLYSKRSLSSIFGVEFPQVAQEEASRENVIPFPQQQYNHNQEQQTQEVAQAAETVDPVKTVTIESTIASPEIVSTAAVSSPTEPEIDSVKSQSNASEREHFQQIIQMHIDILSRQERELDNLKSERDWLRQRIEKLEEKAERDQVLLLSEAQTVKQLIQIQSQRKSALRHALEWCGIIQDENAQRQSIDYSNQKTAEPTQQENKNKPA